MLNRFDLSRPRSVVAWTAMIGAIAGLVAAGYFSIAGEPAIDDAIAIEDQMAHMTGEDHHEDEQVTRSVQRGVGLFGGYMLIGAALGLLLAVTALSLRGSWLDPMRRFVTAGVILAGAIHLAPWIKYPPNPPAVGDEDTVGGRTFAYLLLIVLTGVVLAGAAHLSARLRKAEWDDPARLAAVAVAGTVALAVVLVALPTNTAVVSPEFTEAALAEGLAPESVVWQFRTASLIGQLLMWGVLTMGAGFAFSASRATAAARGTSGAPEAAPSSTKPQAV